MKTVLLARTLLLVACSAGCAGRSSVGRPLDEPDPGPELATTTTTGRPGRLVPSAQRAAPEQDDAVERSALPFYGARSRDGRALAGPEVLDALSAADVICLAGDRDDAHHYWVGLRILHSLVEHAQTSGREVALGLEAFHTPAQKAVGHYLTKDGATERELLKAIEWSRHPGHDYALCRPLVQTARTHQLAILALNASRELTERVAKLGVDALLEDERKHLPDLELGDAQHRALFDARRQAPPPAGTEERAYAAQVLCDETMAAIAATWLAERQPARQLLIVAGADHCRTPAIPQRIRRRTPSRVVSVRPVMLDTGVDLDAVLERYDYAIVLGSDH